MIPKGNVVSYGQVSLMAGVPRGARQVGWILHQHGDQVPWWRVINNAGRISTKCIEHHANIQKDLLEKENIKITQNLNIEIEKYRWKPKQDILIELQLDDEYLFTILDKF